jgi:hypothetical protein
MIMITVMMMMILKKAKGNRPFGKTIGDMY